MKNHQNEALQNAINYNNFNVQLKQWIFNDRRKQNKFYLTDDKGNILSPNLDYDNMNHFILGMALSKKLKK